MLPETSKTVPMMATYVGWEESLPVPCDVKLAKIRYHSGRYSK